MKERTKKLMIIPFAAPGLLLIPLLAMLAGGEMVWSAFDFLVAGILLFGAGSLIALILARVEKPKYRILLIALLLIILFLVWAELAVGIFGTPVAGS
ncbi:MAG: hypothetical protein PHX07_06735 [Candidatus Marinimicrobia bacterium]|jgi:hypothetical protein|nr:hypothetical protein [Candidatus Neomarinimicrobiota bacterium]MDD5710472.1 hypothetical protein [Candidatus Neomarinimicrobiota bacterium]